MTFVNQVSQLQPFQVWPKKLANLKRSVQRLLTVFTATMIIASCSALTEDDFL